MSAHVQPRAIGGKLLDRPMLVLLGLFGVAALFMAWRFVFGIGTVSNMTDGFTWGIWEPVNVVVFTGIGAGAFGVGLLCYLLNRGEYHPLVRPAVLVGAISYTLGGSSIVIALGRYWNAVLLPVVPWWNLASVLLEVAVCVMSYIFVLWVEVLPAVFDGAAESAKPRWAAFGRRWGAALARKMPYVIALAILLPTMHQSSLGGLMLLAVTKVHPLWHTPLLPLLFLVSCLSMGYGAVVVLVSILKLGWNARHDQRLFARMSQVNAGLLVAYLAIRLGDIALHGKLRYLGPNWPTFFFAVELALFAVPAVMFYLPRVQANRGRLFGAALLAVWAGAVYRVNAYMTMYRPAGWRADGTPVPAGWNYFPSLGETTITVGMAAVGVAVFILVSRLFPVVVVEDGRTHTAAGAKSAAAS
ncbi:MAG TPA: Ni/Fe-hydrogenase cytochrome b subunit [Anaeromyxobacter sp.]|nr:Ni/Fe-hydrogenase cytochrome b subunit [Anaeromyxobacter sp.]